MKLTRKDQKFIRRVRHENLSWNRVDDMICISTYDKSRRYFYSLCKYPAPAGEHNISFSVDDIRRNESNIVELDLAKGDPGYDDLLSVYEREVNRSKKIDLDRTEYA